MLSSSERVIKDYEHWTVSLHGNQGYLGRCVIVAKREDAEDLSEATPEEREELFLIINELKNAAADLFQPDWFNYAFLGNIVRHLHGHFLPRYKTSREYGGMIFKDERWGQNYLTDEDFVTPDEIARNIVEDYRGMMIQG